MELNQIISAMVANSQSSAFIIGQAIQQMQQEISELKAKIAELEAK